MKNTTTWKSALVAYGILSVCTCGPAYSQSILKAVKNRAERAATNKVLNETEKAVTKGIDKAIGSVADNGEEATKAHPDPKDQADSSEQEQKKIQSFSRYDFVPGDSVLYVHDFSSDAVGELPSGWNGNGSSVVVDLNSIGGKWLRMAQRSVVLTANEANFGQDFTVEFDLVVDIDFKGWMPPSFQFGLIASGDKSPTANALLNEQKGDKSFYVELSPQSDGGNYALESSENYTRYFNSPPRSDNRMKNWYRRPVHVAMQIQKERLRIWIDGEKLYDAPKGVAKKGEFNQLFFKLASSPYSDEQIGIYVGNVKIAKGLVPPQQQLLQSGSFTTTGILFDTGAARVKPESYGVLKAVADLLAQDNTLRFAIVGHTDNVGNEQRNYTLSEQRAAAVKEVLINTFGITEDRLTTAGKGASAPVASNSTAAGKAQNRRVEFIKQ